MTLEATLELIGSYLKVAKDLSFLHSGKGSLIKCYNETTHRLHTKLDTLGAASGRMTHKSPNITQIPRDKEFRELLSVPKGKLLVDIDADALELVMLGHYLAPYDKGEFARIVDSGSKENLTDIHSINQARTGLKTRDEAKRFIYMTCYGAGESKIGDEIWDRADFSYTKEEYFLAKEKIEKRVVRLNDSLYFPIDKDTLTPLTKELIKATIYGKRVTTLFRDNTKGYKELLAHTINSIENSRIKAIDGRLLYVRSPHKAFNLLLQSAGAIFMKHYLLAIEKELSKAYKKDECLFVANIHDAINLEIIPEIKDEVAEILKQGFTSASKSLNLTCPVKGVPHFGLTQAQIH